VDKITFVSLVSKSGARIYVSIPHDKHGSIADVMGKQVKVTVEDI
jgi:hypothetical protein